MIKLGISLPQFDWYDLRTDVAAAAQGLEAIGFDSAWSFERLLVPDDQSGAHGLYGVPGLAWPQSYRNVPDALLTLATAGAVTSRIELGTAVLVPPLHGPARLAKSLASLDHLVGGRVLAGLGSGWSPDEFGAASPRPFDERGDALDEFLDVAEAAWGPDPVKFQNQRYTIAPANLGPKPARPIPLLFGGQGAKALDRVARRGSGWLPTAVPPAVTGTKLARIREKAAEYGRDPQEVGCTYQIGVLSFERVTSADRQPFTGEPEQLVEDVAALAEVGVDHVFLTATMATRTVSELLDRSAEFHAAVRAAGL